MRQRATSARADLDVITGYAVAMPKALRGSRTTIVHPILAKFMRKHRVKEVADVFKDENLRMLWKEYERSNPLPTPNPSALRRRIEQGTHQIRGARSGPREGELRKAFLQLTCMPHYFEVPDEPHLHAAWDLFHEVVNAATAIHAALDTEPEHELSADYRKMIEKLHRRLLGDAVRRRRFILRLREGAKRYADASSERKKLQAALYVAAWARECDPQFAGLIRHLPEVAAELEKLVSHEKLTHEELPGFEHAARLSCLVGAFGDGPLPKAHDTERKAIRRYAGRFKKAFNDS